VSRTTLKYQRVGIVARELGQAISTLRSAIERGRSNTVTACGLVLVDPAAVERWIAAADQRHRGPKLKAK